MDAEQNGEGGRTPLERIRYFTQDVEDELAGLRRRLAAASNPEAIYGRAVQLIKTLIGDSYLTVDPDNLIRFVDKKALEIMGLRREEVVGRDYNNFIEENPLPEEAGIRVKGSELILMLDNKRTLRLGPCAVIPPILADDPRRFYGAVVRVSKGPEISLIAKAKGIVFRQEDILRKRFKEREENQSGERS